MNKELHLSQRLEERLASRYTILDDGCWEWTGYVSVKGRPKYNQQFASRVVFEVMTNQVIPDDMTLDHLCVNKLCVNPEHLEVVTRAENTRRGPGRGRGRR